MVNNWLFPSSLERGIRLVKMSAQKAAQGAPRAEMVAVHEAMRQMGLHLGASLGVVRVGVLGLRVRPRVCAAD